MAIEFRCPNCDKKLKTGDDKAGRTAKCPQCGTSVTVPAVSAVAEDDFGAFPPLGEAAPGLPPRRGSSGGSQVPCPMCGAMNEPTADRCYACGEDLYSLTAAQPGTERPANFDVGDQLSKGFDLFKAEMGACIVVTLLYLLIPGGINQMLGFALQLVVGGVNQGGGGDAAIGVMVVGQIFVMVTQFLVQVYFDAGCTLFLLNLIRRRPAQISDLFAGGPYFLSLALNRLVFFLMLMVPYLPGGAVLGIGAAVGGDAGPIIMIVGGVLLLIGAGVGAYMFAVFWPYTWVVIDRNPPGLAALKASPHLSAGERGNIVLMGLLYWLLTMAGFLACCIGVLFTLPIVNLMAGIGYDRLIRAKGLGPAVQ